MSNRSNRQNGPFVDVERDGNVVVVYTDGACFNNGKFNARAGIGVFWADDHPDNVSCSLEGQQTSNRAELQAAIAALCIALDNGYSAMRIITDSKYLYKGVTIWMKTYWLRNGWTNLNGNPVANRRDWQELNKLQEQMPQLEWKHTYRGQCYGNEQADILARQGANMDRQDDDYNY